MAVSGPTQPCGLRHCRSRHGSSRSPTPRSPRSARPIWNFPVPVGTKIFCMARGTKIPTIDSKALSIAIKRAMTTRDMRGPALADALGVPYGTLRKILELNTVADYEQLQRISTALRTSLAQIIADADELSKDPEVISDFETSHEDINIDKWADRIKIEDSIKTR